jgi:hypothetical protein
MIQQGKQTFNKKKQLRVLFYHKEDEKLQKEQNRILIWNTQLTIWALVFTIIAALSQIFQNIIDLYIKR